MLLFCCVLYVISCVVGVYNLFVCRYVFQDDKENNEDEVAENFCSDLRRLQQRGKCTDSLCGDIIFTLGKYLNITPTNFRKYDKKMQKAAGISFMRLNGCPVCKKFVYLPSDRRQRCPQQINDDGTVCGSPRCDATGKPFEVCNYTPHSLLFPVIIIITHHSFFCFVASIVLPAKATAAKTSA